MFRAKSGAVLFALLLLTLMMPAKADAQAQTDAANPVPPEGVSADGIVGDEVSATIPVSVAVEDQGGGPETRRSTNRMIEEIIVTAQKREERLQDVPISIQAFSGDAMAARGIESTEQLGQAIPSLQFTGVAGFTLVYLRGLGTDNFVPSADPSVATYIDGIYIPSNVNGTATSLGNVERIEVLKGPQGTLFGRNATGGAISITTRDPGDQFSASAEAELANFDSRSIKADASGPVTDWLSVGVSALSSVSDSYLSNSNYGVPHDQSNVARLKININLADDITLKLTGFYADQQGVGSALNENNSPSLIGRAAQIQPGKADYDTSADFPVGASSAQYIGYGTLTWNAPWLDVKLLLAQQYINNKRTATDFDGSAQPLVAFSIEHGYAKPRTAELQFLSNDNTWGHETFEWIAGIYLMESDAGLDPIRLFVAPQLITSELATVNAQLAQLGLPSIALPAQLVSFFDQPPLNNTPLGSEGLTVELSGLIGTKSASAYTQGTYHISDWIDLTLGGRYQRERRFLTKSTVGAIDPINQEYVNLINYPLDGTTAKNFSPKAVISVKPNDDLLLYASYGVGFKSGTYNIANIYLPPKYIVPEKVTTYELGAKLELAGGLLRFNTAIFNNRIDNLQTGFVSLLSTGAVQFITAPEARTRGAEFDTTWVPLPDFNPGLAVTANAAYIDAKYIDYPNASGFDTTTGILDANVDASGKRIARTPEFSGGLGLVQTIEADHGSYEIAVDGYYNSGFYYDFLNTVEQKAYGLLNGRVSYLHDPWKTRLTLFVNNALNEKYSLQRLQTDFGINDTLAPPRQFGLRLNWMF